MLLTEMHGINGSQAEGVVVPLGGSYQEWWGAGESPGLSNYERWVVEWERSFSRSRPDLAGNTPETALPVVLTNNVATYRDSVDFLTDPQDYFRLDLTQESEVTLRLYELSDSAEVYLRNAGNRIINWTSAQGQNDRILQERLQPGTYYVSVQDGWRSTNYSLDIRVQPVGALPPDQAGNTLATARVVRPELAVTTTLVDWVGTQDPVDVYRFELPEGGRLHALLTRLTGNADLELLNAQGQLLQSSRNSGLWDENIWSNLGAGTYYLRVNAAGGTTGAHYRLNLLVDPPDRVGNTLATAQTITVGPTTTTLTEWVGPWDGFDIYRFATSYRGFFEATLRVPSYQANVELLDAQGQVIPTERVENGERRTISQALDAGTYYLRVRSGGSWAPWTRYHLDVELRPTDGAGNTLQEARFISVGPTTTTLADWVGTQDPVDVYRFEVTTTGELRAVLTGLTGNADLELLNSQGQVLRASRLGGTQDEQFTATLGAGTYYLRVSAASGVASAFYRLEATWRWSQNLDWFDANLRTPHLRTTTRELALDGVLHRNDMLTIFRRVAEDNLVSADELTDLRTILAQASRFNMPEPVRVLTHKVINGDPANEWFNVWRGNGDTLTFEQTIRLGNLFAGATGQHLNLLVDKWFLGKDRPTPVQGHTMQLRYATGTLFGTDNQIHYTDIRQGYIGNCHFMASLSAVALQRPGVIRDMFIDNGDGTWTVRFYGQNNGRVREVDYVTVDRYLPFNVTHGAITNEIYAYYDNGQVGLWVALAEKAFAQMSASRRLQQPESWGSTRNTYDHLDQGGFGYRALAAITGQHAQYYAPFEWGNTGPRAGAFPTLQQLQTWLSQGRAVTAGSMETTTLGIVDLHEYVVIGVDPVTNRVTLYNPWGITIPGEVNGIRTLSYTDFVRNFDMVSVA